MAWVTLDEADDDPHAFCCAVATALMPELNAQAVGVLHRSPRTPSRGTTCPA